MIRSVAGIRVWALLVSIILSCQFSIVNCQVYPVHVTTQLLPPYSVYLADYAAPGCEQLRVVLLQRDLTRPAYQTFLRMSIEWNGREIIRSMPSYRPSPLTTEDLAAALDRQHHEDFEAQVREIEVQRLEIERLQAELNAKGK
jgi:hypothetical protein